MKKNIAKMALALILAGCGGGDDAVPLKLQYAGVLSGTNCFDPQIAMREEAKYSVTIDALAEGARVSLIDASNNSWTGNMTSASSFRLTSASGLDARTSIVGTNVSTQGANIASTTSCVSFRCCTTLTGTVVA